MITGPKKLFERVCASRGYTLDEVKDCIVKEYRLTITVDETHQAYPRHPKPGYSPNENMLIQRETSMSGVGTELKKLLSKIGIKATPNCSCNKRANIMNINGIEWCENNIDTIVGWLREEATKRKLPFVDIAGKILVKRAISNAKKRI